MEDNHGLSEEKFRISCRSFWALKVRNRDWKALVLGIIAFFIQSTFPSGCAQAPLIGGPVDRARLADGIYEGSYREGPNSALVKVTIKSNTIIGIEIVEHQAWRGKQAESSVLNRILEAQSTDVDAVSGATNSSRVIMNAVHQAVEKAYRNQPQEGQ
jgi:uncharacterized protein with FMN-binding domain